MRVEVDAAYFDRLGGLRILARVRSGSELYGVYMWIKDGRVVVAGCTCPDHLMLGECEHIKMVYRLTLEKLGGPTTLELEN